VAEDNPVNREVIAGILGHLGIDHHLVADGEAAVAEVEARPGEWSLVLMDFHMPGIDGLEAAERIRGLGLHSDTLPIVAVTAEPTPPTERATEAIDGWLHKPLRIDQVRDIVEQWTAAEASSDVSVRPDDASAWGLVDGRTWAELERVGDQEFLANLIEKFAADTADHIAALEAAIQDGELQCALDRAHALKGSSGFVAAKAVSQRAWAVEKAAANGDLAEIRGEAMRLEEVFRLTLDELRARIEARPQPEERRGRQHGT